MLQIQKKQEKIGGSLQANEVKTIHDETNGTYEG